MKSHGIGERYRRWAEMGKFELSWPFQRVFTTESGSEKCTGSRSG